MKISTHHKSESGSAPAQFGIRQLFGQAGRILRVSIGYVRDVIVEYRKAQAAERLYAQLRTRSSQDLAKAGMSHKNLARQIYERLYADPSSPG